MKHFALPQIQSLVQTHAKFSSIGLSFSDEQIHLAELTRSQEGKHLIHECASIAYQGSPIEALHQDKSLEENLKKLFKTHAFKTRSVTAAIPNEYVRIIPITYQASKSESSEDIIIHHLAERIDDPLADYVIDYVPVRSPNTDDNQLSLVFLSKIQTTTEFLEGLRKHGLKVKDLEVGPVAIRRLVALEAQKLANDHYENVLIINFGKKKSFLTIISGRRLLFDQASDFGERQLTEKIADLLDLEESKIRSILTSLDHKASQNGQDVEIYSTIIDILRPEFTKFSDDIFKTMSYVASVSRGAQIDKISILGGLSRWPFVLQLLREVIDLPVQTVNVPQFATDIVETKRAENISPFELATSTGLALRGFD